MCPEGEDKREFLRVDYETNLSFKVLKDDKLTVKPEVATRNISASGLLFRASSENAIPPLSSIVWIGLDPKMMNICSEIEADLVIHNNGVFGRVVRIAEGEPGLSYDIGVCFLRKTDMSDDEIKALTSE